MKHIILLILCSVVLLSACTSKEIKINRKFKDDKVLLNIHANQSSPLNPWKVEMKAKAYSLEEGTLFFDHENSGLKAEDITYTWIDETTCIIGFPYADNRIRKFRFIASPENYSLLEINE